MSLPNLLTFLRILIIPVFLTAYIYGARSIAAGLFIGAAMTDLLDGFLARSSKQTTRLGALLDPFADKLLLLSSFGLLAYRGVVPLWVLIAVISKDVVVVSGWMMRYFLTRRSSALPSFLGKAATFMQVVAITAILTAHMAGFIQASCFPLLVFASGLTALSGMEYLYRGLKELGQNTGSG